MPNIDTFISSCKFVIFVSCFSCLIVAIMAAAASTPAQTTTAQAEEQVSLKLVVNKETNKVLFAEAEKDFVDILCSFLTLPLGTIARLVEKESNMGPVTVGCLNSLYRSVADLDKDCMWTDTSKEMLLHPRNSSEGCCNTLKFNIDDTEPQKYFICSSYGIRHSSISATSGASCGCGWFFTSSVSLKHFSKGFVNSAATFIITDELIVIPNSLDYTSFGLLQNLGIKSPSSVKEMTVNVTNQKVLDLLKCSLLSKSTLTDLFLGKKEFLERSRFFSYGVENNSSSSSIQIKLKLVIRKSDGKLLYAQGEQDFADLLLSFLAFPLGGVVLKLGGNCFVGCIDRLYGSIVDLNENKYMMSMEAKNRLVDPYLAPEYYKLSKLILPVLKPSVLRYYCFSSNNSTIHVQFLEADEHITNSEVGSFSEMNLRNPISATGSHDGYVKGPAMYLVTDDLVVAPLSPISALDLLNRLKTPFNDLKEKVVTIGVKECLSILKASLTSTSALTNGLSHLLTEVKEEK